MEVVTIEVSSIQDVADESIGVCNFVQIPLEVFRSACNRRLEAINEFSFSYFDLRVVGERAAPYAWCVSAEG